MSHTPEQREQYWKIRIADKINLMQGQFQLDKSAIVEILDHIGLSQIKYHEQLNNIELAFANILTELERKESENEKPKQSPTNRKSHKRAGA